ncbi:hypothetical protein [Actinoplanes sp. NPDC051411]|uniref:hypothetical protein n=1 Tax=Actinoplanes sp. NPDC051411 TaxID=3155522 RepID=UPI003424668D
MKPEKRAEKSIGIEKSSTGVVRRDSWAARVFRDAGGWARIHGASVSTSIVLRARSKW